jgi:hypothetical protein
MRAENPAAAGDLVAFESKRKYRDIDSPWFVARVVAIDEDGYVTEVEGKHGPTPIKSLSNQWYLIPTPLLKADAPIDEALHTAWVSREAITALLKPFCVDDYKQRRDAFYEDRRAFLKEQRSASDGDVRDESKGGSET